MKTAVSVAALITAASAQFYNITSKPFQIHLRSEDGSVDDTVSACHTGAAIESLCLSNSNTTSKPDPTPYDTFNFNSSIYSQPIAGTNFGTPGILTWVVPASPPIPSSVQFFYDPSTNSALPLLFPGDQSPQTLYFDDQDQLTVVSYVDWSANPPQSANPVGLQRWYACKTYYLGYQYENLVWGLGEATPENPTCVPVKVKRVFV
ncbi:hypothetical protein IQ06DRAFT_297003 [Phaeosphaeriaceae sp. SRC1lsM3a]|nr:hypothetical protein IQ06DRAFT_297003 [Stagonospora sp. SRC1lsM3a]